MTTIAFDGKILAADQCSWSGGVRRRVRKVFKISTRDRGPLLVAFCGKGSYCLQVLAWMKGEGDKPKPSEWFGPSEIGDQCCLCIDSQYRVWCLGNDLHWQEMREEKYAQGAGQEFAWGALEAGATAEQAILIAIKRSDFAGFGCDTVSFDA